MSQSRPRTEAELIEHVRSLDAHAPAELHRKVGLLVNAHEQDARRRRIPAPRARAGRSRRGLGLAGALAVAAVVALALVLSTSGGTGAPTLTPREASALTLSAATAPAPAESHSNGAHLAAAVDGVAFPYWEDHFGWRSTGARSGRVAGRAVTTVFYENGGRRLGYAIVAGTPAPRLSGGSLAWRAGVPYRLITNGETHMITWLRNGHLCVVSARGVDSATLLRLASWADSGYIAS